MPYFKTSRGVAHVAEEPSIATLLKPWALPRCGFAAEKYIIIHALQMLPLVLGLGGPRFGRLTMSLKGRSIPSLLISLTTITSLEKGWTKQKK
jgi:hypothetical protein